MHPTMAGYSGTPLWKKLGYRDGVLACALGSPASYRSALALPSEVRVCWTRRASVGIPFVHVFVTSRKVLAVRLRALRKVLHSAGTIWVSWPKQSSGVRTDLTEDVVRELALPLGLVDIKVCAIDEIWSGLKLVIRKEFR